MRRAEPWATLHPRLRTPTHALSAPGCPRTLTIAAGTTPRAPTPPAALHLPCHLQGASGEYRGVADCFSKIVRTEGWGALFRGWEPRVLWIGVGGSIFFSVLEASKASHTLRCAALWHAMV